MRGFGFTHDGSADTVLHFLGGRPFTLAETERRQLEAFLLAYDSDLAPVVGQQVTGSARMRPRAPTCCGRGPRRATAT